MKRCSYVLYILLLIFAFFSPPLANAEEIDSQEHSILDDSQEVNLNNQVSLDIESDSYPANSDQSPTNEIPPTEDIIQNDVNQNLPQQPITPDEETTFEDASSIQNNALTSSYSENEIYFSDYYLKYVILDALGKESWESVYPSDMISLNVIYAKSQSISNITGLENATNLEDLTLWDNYVSDISPLTNLTNLTYLDLDNNNITDLSPLYGKQYLHTLFLTSNPISDISVLLSLPNLQYVNLEGLPLDLTTGSSAMNVINSLISRGVEVNYDIPLNPDNKPGWVQDQYGYWYYYNEDLSLKMGEWLLYNNQWYYLDEYDGHMVTGKQYINGSYYYLSPITGAMLTGWINDGTDWYFANYNSGTLKANEWYLYNYRWYFLDDEAVMATGTNYINGKRYSFYSDGILQTNSWGRDESGWFYTTSSGEFHSGWLFYGSKWYFLDYDDNRMATGNWEIDGIPYYFDKNGIMQNSGWAYDGSDWYYATYSGALKTGWFNYGGRWYYLDSYGTMQTGFQKVNYTWYYFDQNGIMSTGWVKVGPYWHYFNADGSEYYGWLKYGGYWYYLNNEGIMVYGDYYYIGWTWYYFDYSGRLVE
jgi:glucan-binding YG repeat protein